MEIQIDLEYLQADIYYWKNVEMLWKAKKKDEILQLLAHEVSHILLEELALESKTQSKRHRKALERATEHTSRLLYRLYKDSKVENSSQFTGDSDHEKDDRIL